MLQVVQNVKSTLTREDPRFQGWDFVEIDVVGKI